MRSVFAFLILVVLSVLALVFITMQRIPQPIATAVIGEKPQKVIGGQAVQLLPSNLSEKQHKLLNMAYEVAKANGFKNPEVVQAVLLQETHAGGLKSYRVANPGPEAYFGPMQIKLAAAKDVLQRWPFLFTVYGFHTRTDDEIKANLILNDRFNLEVGTRYLKLLQQEYGFSGRALMNAYNRGPGGVQEVDNSTFHYAIGAERKLTMVKQKR